MNHSRDGLLSIGAFANVTRLSLKALRLYAQLGILKPCFVDPDSGYRYYHPEQVRAARLIRVMREMDMPLATIRDVLQATPEEAERLVRYHWQAMELRLEQARRMVPDLLSALRQEAKVMAFEVSVRTVGPQAIISITRHVKVDQLGECIRDNLYQLYALIETNKGKAAGAPFGVFHGAINHESDGPIEICVPVQQAIRTQGEVQARELPGGQMACVMMHGKECDFPDILKGYDAAADWIHKHGYKMQSSPLEIWHSRPGEPDQMEVAWPFQEQAEAQAS